MRVQDVVRLDLGTFVRPAEETGTGQPRVEAVLGYVARTPGHVDGHQSVVLECDDGSVVLAGQSHDTASQWSAVLAARARGLGHDAPLPEPNPWVARLLAFDPRRVIFAHDAAVWVL
jgi:N-acyl homoserine lactone hydrolase